MPSLSSFVGHTAQKRYGQHWLKDPNIIRKIVAAAQPFTPTDTVLEIGPGRGDLTQELLLASSAASPSSATSPQSSHRQQHNVCHVYAVEIDHTLVQGLASRFAHEIHAARRLSVIHGDVLSSRQQHQQQQKKKHYMPPPPTSAGHDDDEDDGRYISNNNNNNGDAGDGIGVVEITKVVANIPYNITGPLLERLVGRLDHRGDGDEGEQQEDATNMVQQHQKRRKRNLKLKRGRDETTAYDQDNTITGDDGNRVDQGEQQQHEQSLSPSSIRFSFDQCEQLVLLVQREVAHRICARPGDANYSALSVRMQLLLEKWDMIVPDVPPTCFVPPPNVHSTVISLVPKKGRGKASPNDDDDDVLPVATGQMVDVLLRAAFRQRRKMLRSSLLSLAVPTSSRMLPQMEENDDDTSRRRDTSSSSSSSSTKKKRKQKLTREQLERLAKMAEINLHQRPQEIAPSAWVRLAECFLGEAAEQQQYRQLGHQRQQQQLGR